MSCHELKVLSPPEILRVIIDLRSRLSSHLEILE